MQKWLTWKLSLLMADIFIYFHYSLHLINTDYFTKSRRLRNRSSRFLSRWPALNENPGSRLQETKISLPRRRCTLGIFGYGCAAGALEPLAYIRASSAEFCYPTLNLIPQIPPYPRVAVFQKLLRPLKQSSQRHIRRQDKTIYFIWGLIPAGALTVFQII